MKQEKWSSPQAYANATSSIVVYSPDKKRFHILGPQEKKSINFNHSNWGEFESDKHIQWTPVTPKGYSEIENKSQEKANREEKDYLNFIEKKDEAFRSAFKVIEEAGPLPFEPLKISNPPNDIIHSDICDAMSYTLGEARANVKAKAREAKNKMIEGEIIVKSVESNDHSCGTCGEQLWEFTAGVFNSIACNNSQCDRYPLPLGPAYELHLKVEKSLKNPIDKDMLGESFTPRQVAYVEEQSKSYDMVNPSHYKDKQIETIEKMRRIWGNEAVALYCDMNEFRYRERIGDKPENPIEQESKKIQWYKAKAKELRE